MNLLAYCRLQLRDKKLSQPEPQHSMAHLLWADLMVATVHNCRKPMVQRAITSSMALMVKLVLTETPDPQCNRQQETQKGPDRSMAVKLQQEVKLVSKHLASTPVVLQEAASSAPSCWASARDCSAFSHLRPGIGLSSLPRSLSLAWLTCHGSFFRPGLLFQFQP